MFFSVGTREKLAVTANAVNELILIAIGARKLAKGAQYMSFSHFIDLANFLTGAANIGGGC